MGDKHVRFALVPSAELIHHRVMYTEPIQEFHSTLTFPLG